MKTGSRRLHFVDLGSRCILRQLQLEEALLRNDSRSFVLLNRALPRERSIVLGTSGKAHEHVHVEKARADGVRLIRRYTGGGTVYIDNGTFFVSFVMSVNNVPHVESFPRPIMHWSSQLYKEMFDKCSSAQHFRMQENDYCFGERKFGGNAQSIAGKRWVHHTSFLWNCDLASMQRYLQMPAKRPSYRGDRTHADFVCGLSEFVSDFSVFRDSLQSTLQQHFDVVEERPEQLEHLLQLSHRRCTSLLDIDAAASSMSS